jgi:tetratricopeptide (TPR) repeat protein
MPKLTLFLVFTGLMATAGCNRNSPSQNAYEAVAGALIAETLGPSDTRVLFYNPRAEQLLRAAKLNVPGFKDDEHRSALAAACRDPDLFRRLDRRYRFDALLLSGDPAEYQPLLDHLIQTRDWTLVHLDSASLIFRRGDVKAWKPRNAALLPDDFAALSNESKTEALAQLGIKLLAIDRPHAAKEALDSAIALPGDSPAAYTAMALYHTRYHRWDEALKASDKALDTDPGFVPALVTKSQILFSTGNANEALRCSRQLVSFSPDDPNHLFLHAKISHQAHAYVEEIAALTKVVALANQQKVPTSGYRIYLGQAYAASGQAASAVQQFKAALKEGTLSDEQKKYVEESIERIGSHAAAL